MLRTALLVTAATLGVAAPALAVTATMGNDATDRVYVDSYANFTIVDTNNPAPSTATSRR